MQDFLNPKSMLTPGMAGTFLMFLVNGLVIQFPEMSPRFTALALSFVVGASVFYSHSLARTPILGKATYWVLNSLVVFIVGFGATHFAADATSPAGAGGGAYLPAIVSTAYAQDSTPKKDLPAAKAPAQPDAALKQQLERERTENEKLKDQVRALQEKNAPSKPRQDRGFFQRW